MWRYYLVAALLIVALGSVVFAHRLAANGWKLQPDAKGVRAPAHGSGNEGFVTTPEPSFVGQGGWVLSALPDCFDQQSSIEGPSQALAFHVPPARERFAPGAVLRVGNCVVRVRAHDIWAFRGNDRLRVPAEARLYDTKDGLTLVYEHGGRTEVRIYRPRR